MIPYLLELSAHGENIAHNQDSLGSDFCCLRDYPPFTLRRDAMDGLAIRLPSGTGTALA